MIVESPQIKPPEAPEVEALDAGVIEEARRRQRRERIIVACVAALLAGAVAGIVAFGLGGGGRHAPPVQRSSPPTWLTGPPLSGPTHLRLVVSENTGPASIVDVDSGQAQAVRSLGVPRRQRTWSPALYPLTAAPGGALAVVTRQDCARCTVTQTEFLIGADGSVRRTARLTLARDQHTSTPALGSASASWVLTWPRSGHCMLRLEPGSRPAVAVPCGSLRGDTPAGLVISRGSEVMLVDPRTGRVRERFAVHGQFDVISTNVALISTAPGIPGEGDAYPTRPDAREPLDRCPLAPAVAEHPALRLPRVPRTPRVAGRGRVRRPRVPALGPAGQRRVAARPAYRRVHARPRVPDPRAPQILRHRVDRRPPSRRGRARRRAHRDRRMAPRQRPAPSAPRCRNSPATHSSCR